jgi:hypothetical protein
MLREAAQAFSDEFELNESGVAVHSLALAFWTINERDPRPNTLSYLSASLSFSVRISR